MELEPFRNCELIGSGVSGEQYRKQDFKRGDERYVMTRSDLMEFARCPHRWVAGYNSEGSEATEWGALIDCLFLDAKNFPNRYAVCPEQYKDEKSGELKPWNWNANICKAWRQNQGEKITIKTEQLNSVGVALDVFLKDTDAATIREISRPQVMVVGEYLDRSTEIVVPVKALIDAVPNIEHPILGKCLVDLKTAANADPEGWPRVVFSRGYDAQAAFYKDVYQAATGEDRPDFLHLIQESFPPYEIGKRYFGEGSDQVPGFLQIGRHKYLSALRAYARCLLDQRWPSYDDNGTTSEFMPCEPEPWMMMKASRLTPEREAIAI